MNLSKTGPTNRHAGSDTVADPTLYYPVPGAVRPEHEACRQRTEDEDREVRIATAFRNLQAALSQREAARRP